MEPTNVEILPNDLAINWSDGHESYIDFVTLRNACPCAACRGEGHLWGKTAPTIDASKLGPDAFEMVSVSGVGSYAISFVWGDRHDSGIFSYTLLKSLCQCDNCVSERANKTV